MARGVDMPSAHGYPIIRAARTAYIARLRVMIPSVIKGITSLKTIFLSDDGEVIAAVSISDKIRGKNEGHRL